MSALLTAPKLVLSRKHNGMRMEPEEFDSISVCNENWSYELINGVLVEIGRAHV